MKKYIAMTFGVLCLSLTACKRDPSDRLSNPIPEGSVSQTSGVYTIYDDELKTGGGLGFIPGGENQSIDILETSNPKSGLAQIRYEWNGGDVFNADATPPANQHLFAGFSLLVTPDFSNLTSANAKDLSGPAYTRLVMDVRGSLSAFTSLRIEGPTDGSAGASPARADVSSLGATYQEISLTIPAADFNSVRVFMTLSLQYAQPARTTNPGSGGVVYLDNIRYER